MLHNSFTFSQKFLPHESLGYKSQELTINKIISPNSEHLNDICFYAEIYEIKPEAIAHIIYTQAQHQNEIEISFSDQIVELLQDPLTNQEWNQLFKTYYEQELNFIKKLQKSSKKSRKNHLIFNSVGSIEMQTYTALKLIQKPWFVNKKIFFINPNTINIKKVVQHLIDNQSNIAFIAAEVKAMQNAYKKYYSEDFSVNHYNQLVWELHALGNFEYFANQRKIYFEQHGKNKPIQNEPLNSQIQKKISSHCY